MACVGVEQEDSLTLPECFDFMYKLHQDLENAEESTASDSIQGRLRKGIQTTTAAIKMVNELELFSRNEDIDEISTAEIKYLMLSAYLGYFTGLNIHMPRKEAVVQCSRCYKDFLRLCGHYSVIEHNVDNSVEEEEDENVTTLQVRNRVQDVNAMSAQRNNKIQRFKEKKAMEKKLSELKAEVEKDHVDDEVKRDFFLTQVKHWANLAVDEIDNCQMELRMLQHRDELKNSSPTQSSSHNGGQNKPKPFRPFILTKTEIQKKVFGAGYPALPTMTVEEFYEQKLKEGTLSESVHGGHSMQNWAEDPERDARQREMEDAEKERNLEEEDPETIARMRAMDDWKDEHRRGDGNRHNMG